MEPLFRRLLGEDIELVVHLAEGVKPVELEPSQVEQCVVNLLVNARDAMPRGGRIEVELSGVRLSAAEVAAHPQVSAGEFARLSVRDQGTGIDEEALPHIFEPFFTTKSKGEHHSGLGLATVYGIMRQNGGFVSVESQPGEGTAFHLLFPTTERPVSQPSEGRSELPRAAGARRILLVEDNPAMRQSTRDLLETLGHRVTAAADPREALEGFDPPYDLVVSDVIMPGMSGKELVERLRRSQPHLPCLYISGHTEGVTLRHGLVQEEVHFLQKPFSARELHTKIQAMLVAPA
jgi:CheY-like chemotaxis protein